MSTYLTLLKYIILKRVYYYVHFQHFSSAAILFPAFFAFRVCVMQSYQFVSSYSFVTLYMSLTAEEASDWTSCFISY